MVTEVKEKPPRTIQLQYPVYERLEVFRGKRETFSQAVDRLLTMVERIGAMQNMVARVLGAVNFLKTRSRMPESSLKLLPGNKRRWDMTKKEALRAYKEAIAPAWKAYEKVEAPARKTYYKAEATAWKAYDEAVATARKAYEEAEAPVWKTYKKAVAKARKAYDEAVATAKKAYYEAVATVWKAYEKAVAKARKAYDEAIKEVRHA